MIFKYDGSHEKCPVPLVRMRLLLKKLQVGDQCIVLINDPGSLRDIPKLLAKQGYNFSQLALADNVVEIIVDSK